MTPINNCDLDSEAVGSGEYVLSGANIWFREINDKLISEANNGIVTDHRISGTGLTLNCTASDTPVDILVPKYNYKGYRIYNGTGEEYPLINGANNLVSFTLPSGYDGPVYIKYREPLYWRLAEIISLITLVSMFLITHRDT